MALIDRIDALTEVIDLGRGALPEDLVADVRAVAARAGARQRLSTEHTVVALAGTTGSGKSSLVNALTGTDVAEVGVTRPTTSRALALVRGEAGSGELLDWLGVTRRHVLAPEPAAGSLILLDLPDVDSVRSEHRVEAERLAGMVDLLVWVLDPQKYADATVHGYLAGLGEHREVVLVVLNQVDRLDPQERVDCRRDLERLLALDGLAGVPVQETSTVTGEGVTSLRRALDDAARRRQSARARIDADLAQVARRVQEACAPVDARTRAARTDPADAQLVDAQLVDARFADAQLVDALVDASGAPLVVDAVAASWRLRAALATGWPPLRWLRRLRPDPIRRLHVEGDPLTARTSLRTGPAELARLRTAVRAHRGAATADLPASWAALAAAEAPVEDLSGELDRAVATTPLPTAPPRHWRVLGAAQWLALAVATTGAGWLVALAIADALRFRLEAPVWGPLPWPTVLLAGGLLLGLALTLLGAGVARVGARRRAAVARRRLRRAVAEVAGRLVVDPLDRLRDRWERCLAAARHAEGKRR